MKLQRVVYTNRKAKDISVEDGAYVVDHDNCFGISYPFTKDKKGYRVECTELRKYLNGIEADHKVWKYHESSEATGWEPCEERKPREEPREDRRGSYAPA
jgi:hypothetical protein